MSESSSSSDSSNDESENGEQQAPQQDDQFGETSSMSSSTSSSEDEAEHPNQPGGAEIGQPLQQQTEVEGAVGGQNVDNLGGQQLIESGDEHEIGPNEEIQKEVTTEDEEEDGIFTTNDDGREEQGQQEEAGGSEGKELQNRDHDDEEEDNREETAHVIERMEVSDDEEEEEVEDTGPVKIDLDMARSKADLGEEGPYFVKLPNFLSIDTKPFEPETYDDELEEDEVLDDEGRTRLKLKMENTIRWRIIQDKQGNERRESNARIVRWSDGSMSLYLGGEVFEVDKQRIMDFNHLYIRQGAALQAQSVFGEKLVFRPHSTDTLTHRKMTMNMAEKTSKAQKVRMLANVGDNPDAQKKEMIRLEEEKLRAAARREAQQRRVRERPRAMGLTSGFLEGYESDEGGAESLAAIKRRYQHAPYGVGGGRASAEREHSYSESDEEREERKQRKNINEAKIDSDEDEEDGGEEMETSDTEQRPTSHKSQSKEQQKKKIVIDEDEDE